MTDEPLGATAPGGSVPEQRPAPQEAAVTVPGGIPGVPALTIGASSALTAVSTAGLAGGPVGAVLVAGGLAATAAMVAVARAPRTDPSSRTRTRSTPRSATATSSGARSGQGAAGGYRPVGGAFRTGGRSVGGGLGARTGGGGSALRAGARAGVGGLRGRVGQIRAARAAQAALPAGRRERRETLSADRRRVADQRRAVRATGAAAGGAAAPVGPRSASWSAQRAARGAGATTPVSPARGAHRRPAGAAGRVGGVLRSAARSAARAGRTAVQAGRAAVAGRRTAPGTAGTAPGSAGSAGRDRRRENRRTARDGTRNRRVSAIRAGIERRSRVRSRQAALRRAALRHQARRAGAVLAAAPAALLSLLLWPITRLMNIRSPQWGRRVYRHLAGAAREDRLRAEVAAYQAHEREEAEAADLDREALPAPDRAASTDAPATIPTTQEIPVTNPAAFDFRQAAEEMLRQAQTAEPGGMMHVLAAFETLPEALGLIAETFAVVASRCSEEMPLDPGVGDALQEVNKALLGAVEGAAEVSRVFAMAHEQDIRRHVDPRVGEEAWDTTANADHTAQSQG
ncbi:hypothetical protein [Streptomyces lavendulae]|uniref:hypothetical protein n=1 Tax=Streptomyces lavendulae TaxID=1914 RepID=UPI0036E4AF1D